jgi:hypothetical protein
MKRLLATLPLFFPLLFSACSMGGGGTGGGGGSESTGVVFDNTTGSCPVSVYETSERTESAKITEVAAGAASAVIPWRANPGGYTFYLAFQVFIEDIPVIYIPKPGADQLVHRIDANIINTVALPPVDATVDSVDTLLSGAAYIVLQNTSYNSCYLLKGSLIVTPDNAPDSHIVNSSEKAIYRFSAPGTAAEYKLFANGKKIDFSGVDGDFEVGRIYTFLFSDAVAGEVSLSMKSSTEIVLANVSMSQGANKDYSFTSWRDKKLDNVSGETVTGDNAIVFYASSAKLIGPYWQHPSGDFNYNGQILESYFSAQNDGMVIWTLKSERMGYLLKMQEDQSIYISGIDPPHPFYKQ